MHNGVNIILWGTSFLDGNTYNLHFFFQCTHSYRNRLHFAVESESSRRRLWCPGHDSVIDGRCGGYGGSSYWGLSVFESGSLGSLVPGPWSLFTPLHALNSLSLRNHIQVPSPRSTLHMCDCRGRRQWRGAELGGAAGGVHMGKGKARQCRSCAAYKWFDLCLQNAWLAAKKASMVNSGNKLFVTRH